MDSFGAAGPIQIVINPEDQLQLGLTIRRRFFCGNYETCLCLAAALNWDNFTCRGCSGDVNKSLVWRAHQARRHDRVAKRICKLPIIESYDLEPQVLPLNVRTAKA